MDKHRSDTSFWLSHPFFKIGGILKKKVVKLEGVRSVLMIKKEEFCWIWNPEGGQLQKLVLRCVEEGDRHLSFGFIHPNTAGVTLQVTMMVLARDLGRPKPFSVTHSDAAVPWYHPTGHHDGPGQGPGHPQAVRAGGGRRVLPGAADPHTAGAIGAVLPLPGGRGLVPRQPGRGALRHQRPAPALRL